MGLSVGDTVRFTGGSRAPGFGIGQFGVIVSVGEPNASGEPCWMVRSAINNKTVRYWEGSQSRRTQMDSRVWDGTFEVGDCVRLDNVEFLSGYGEWAQIRHLHCVGLIGDVVAVNPLNISVRFPEIAAATDTVFAYNPIRFSLARQRPDKDMLEYYNAISGESNVPNDHD